jgi:AraC-like DNA-binding protein
MARIVNTVFSLDSLKVKLRYAYEWVREPNWMPRHIENPCTVIWLIVGGERIFRINGQELHIKPMDVIVIPPFTSFSVCPYGEQSERLHYFSLACDWKVGSFDFVNLFQFPTVSELREQAEFDALKAVWMELLQVWDTFVAEVVPIGAIIPLVKEEHFPPRVEIRSSQAGGFLGTLSLFYKWSSVFLSLTASGLPEVPKLLDERIEHVCSYVAAHYTDKLTMGDLCEIVFMSESHLRLLFKKRLNISPMNYVLSYRLEKAKELLIETTNPIGLIAQSVGIDDISYFSRIFRKRERMTPAEYRRRMVNP